MTFREQIYAALSTVAPTMPYATGIRAARPYITYMLVSGTDNANLRGDGPENPRFQLSIWSEDPDQADLLKAQAKVALRAGAKVGFIFDNPDDFEEDTKLFQRGFDASLWL
jgi:hypothetical protein